MPSEVAKRLRDRRLNVWNECREIAEKAAEENRALSDEEQGKWDAMQDEMSKLDTRIKAVLETEKRAKEADDAFDALSGRKPAEGQARGAPGSKMLEEVRKWARGDEGAGRALEVRRAPELGPINYRVLTTGGTSASSIVPTDFYDMLIAHLIEVSGVMQCGPTVLNTGGGETLQVPKTTAHSTAASASQAAPLPTADPAFSMQTLAAYKYGVLLQVARELIDDTAVDLLGYLAMQAGRALGNAFGTDLVNGTGTGQPTGIITASTVGVTGSVTGVSGAPSYANLVDLEYSVIAPYRQSRSCYWLAADKTIGGFRKITDTTGRPIWEPSAVLGSPDLLLGKPLVADPFMPAMTTGSKSIAFGDFSQFFVRLVGGVRFERSDDFAFGSDLVTFRAILRGDGTLVDRTGAIRLYQGAASLCARLLDQVSFLLGLAHSRAGPGRERSCPGSGKTGTRPYARDRSAGRRSFSARSTRSSAHRIALTRRFLEWEAGSPLQGWSSDHALTRSAGSCSSLTGPTSSRARERVTTLCPVRGSGKTTGARRGSSRTGRTNGVDLTRISESVLAMTTGKLSLPAPERPRKNITRGSRLSTASA